MSSTPVILFSGMGADDRVFAKQKEQLPRIEVPAWIDPLPNETLSAYAERFAKIIDPGEPCFIGGASFGGFIAMEMIQHLNPIGCFLIGSARSPSELPRGFNVLRKVTSAANAIPFEAATLLSKVMLLSSGKRPGAPWNEIVEQLSDSDAAFLRWACQAVLGWEGNVQTHGVPIHQIHGAKDFVLPVTNTTPDVVIPNAGHAISMTRPDEVTEFLVGRIREFSG